MKSRRLVFAIIILIAWPARQSALAHGGGHGGGGHGGGFGGGGHGGGFVGHGGGFGGHHHGGGFMGGIHAHSYGGLGFYGGLPYYSPYYANPYYGGLYYGNSPYYPSSGINMPPAPPVYIEQSSTPAIQPREIHNWDYCRKPEGYYPHVPACPTGWQSIDPQPLGQVPGYWYYCVNPAGYYPYVRACLAAWQQIVP